MKTPKPNSAENMRPAPIAYEIQIRTLADGWVNTWTYEDSNGDMRPETFASREAAEAALEEYLQELAEDASLGNISDYDRDEFRVQAVAACVALGEERAGA